ncbi:manganese ABC transporter ATP-binding protein [Enterococcus florum]|uniref:Manganese ABC transporter ATP-binding protein n=1 Tax=Enterococcus florum TaxID=2480627 RepID=A0A4P5P9X9_9ENTE|nr:metal ABC transporter ATP-binding protein [Enterococcus florum]GCF93154.1 manganese ABC transporter ATP-binding protein [Enterococcus florum]
MIECKQLSVSYNNQVVALKDIDFVLEGPTITGIIGPNGAGKSTLLKAILSVIPHKGATLIDGQPSEKVLSSIAYVEQKSAIDFTFPITVKECVSLGTYPAVGLFKRLKKKNWQDVAHALEQVGLSDYSNRQISELSGGQFQRVLVARCLVQQAEYIFLDEPFVGIDSVSEGIIMQTLQQLKAEGKTILIVHHDLGRVEQYFDQVILLNKQLIAAGKTRETFCKRNLIHAYGETIFIGQDAESAFQSGPFQEKLRNTEQAM